MKKIYLTAFILLGSVFTLQAQDSAQATFDRGNTYLENGELAEALNTYRRVENSGQVSGALFLNMGIVSVQLDSLGLAKYYFLKAQEFETTQDDAQKALNYVEGQFSRRSAILPKLPWDRAVHWMIEVPGAALIFVSGFLITISGLLLLYAGWFSKLSLQRFFPYILTLIISGSIIAGLAFYADYVDQRYDEAVLISSSQRVVQQPEEGSSLISIAYEGYDLTVDQWKSEEQDNWLYIRLGNGQFGWIQNDGIKIL